LSISSETKRGAPRLYQRENSPIALIKGLELFNLTRKHEVRIVLRQKTVDDTGLCGEGSGSSQS